MTGEKAKGESKNLPATRITARGILIGSLLLILDHVLVLHSLSSSAPRSSSWVSWPATIHWASTVREEAEDGAGAAPPAAGEVGGDGCGWPWPWELVRWRRHLKDPACVGGAHTHLAPPPPPEEADEKLRRMVRGDAAAAPVGVVLALWWCGPWNRPSSPVVST
ncbi:hypothetical protein C2845_PM11G06210 [Panicum miliaceum]|uniref:Uncharacterized protein n=1 Tax=Panicum miliaceum TaxID=4540 RepID=A0A3L6RQM7_PANMI|nr:hypothetical protein C2845_PM11G06210 [Panicum miliaceum]